MEQSILDIIRTRRSCRKYTSLPLEEELIKIVVEAGRYAPSGGNNQTTRFTVIEGRKALDELAGLVSKVFSGMEDSPALYQSIRSSIRQSKAGGYDFTYGAPVLVILTNRREYGNAMADCAAAAQNMLLAAHSLGIGSCWINQLRWLRDTPEVIEKLAGWGIPEEEFVCAAVALGHPASPAGEPLPRKGNPVAYIRS